jgi:hypothetical protein
MFRQLNELQYNAKSGETYIIYFLKFWKTKGKKGDFVTKYQIRSSDRDFVWYGRISKERVMDDLNLTPGDIKRISNEELEHKIEEHLKKLLVHVIKKGLDRGFVEPNTEFVFYKKPIIKKRVWKG